MLHLALSLKDGTSLIGAFYLHLPLDITLQFYECDPGGSSLRGCSCVAFSGMTLLLYNIQKHSIRTLYYIINLIYCAGR